jgi:hypothetical protein
MKRVVEPFNTEYINTVDVFKDHFSNEVKELWDIFNNPDGKTHKDIYDKTTHMLGFIEYLRNEMKGYVSYSENCDDWL